MLQKFPLEIHTAIATYKNLYKNYMHYRGYSSIHIEMLQLSFNSKIALAFIDENQFCGTLFQKAKTVGIHKKTKI